MTRVIVVVAGLLLVVVGGGFAYLAAFDIPAPRAKIEKPIPNDRLPR